MSDFVQPDGNPEYVRRMQELRRSSAAQPHKDKKREFKRGWGKGGRNFWRRTL